MLTGILQRICRDLRHIQNQQTIRVRAVLTPVFWSLQKLLQKILREWQRNETLPIYSFSYTVNLTFSGINYPQQRRPPPASTWTSCRPSWSPPRGGSSTPPRWRWSGAASCCRGTCVNIFLRNATQKIALSNTTKWTRRPDLFKTTVSWTAPCLYWFAPEYSSKVTFCGHCWGHSAAQ